MRIWVSEKVLLFISRVLVSVGAVGAAAPTDFEEY